jgi:PAS domain S-box-containing protein
MRHKNGAVLWQILNALPEATLVVARDGVIVAHDAQASLLFGYSERGLVGMPIAALIPERSRAAHTQRCEEYQRAPTARPMLARPAFAVRGDGHEVPIEVTLEPTLSEGAPAVLCRARLAVNHLADSKHRLLVESAPDAMLLVTRQGIIDFVNQQTARLFGYAPEELTGRPVELLVPSSIRAEHPRLRQAFQSAPRSRAMGQGKTLRACRKDGSEFLADISLAPVATDAGLMTSVVVRDVTDQRRLEERVQALQRIEAVGRLAGGIAHDFNNLLTAIFNFGAFVLETLDPSSPAAADQREVLSAAERARNLTAQLLAFSRKRIVEPQSLNLNRTVDSIDRMLRRVLGENIDYSTRLHEGLWSAWVDPGAIEQVIVNLALNARDAMPSGGKLTIETDNAILDERNGLERETEVPAGEYVVIAVTDSGHGMDTATLARIFEPFFTTKSEGQGTGLGLSTSYGIVRQAGGYIWVNSEVGRGATFKVYLPRTLAEPEPPRASSRPCALEGTETILLAEDDGQVRALTLRTLTRLGYTVLETKTGAEALAVCESHPRPIHLLLTDVIMPDLTGKALAERVVLRRSGLEVLYMSGYTSDVIVPHGVLDEHVALLQKPFTPDQLARAVRRALDDVGS